MKLEGKRIHKTGRSPRRLAITKIGQAIRLAVLNMAVRVWM